MATKLCCDEQQQLFCAYKEKGGDPALYDEWLLDGIAQRFWAHYQEVPMHYWTIRYAYDHSSWGYDVYRRSFRVQWRRCCDELHQIDTVYGSMAMVFRWIKRIQKLLRIPAYIRGLWVAAKQNTEQ